MKKETIDEKEAEIISLKARLNEAEEMLTAIRMGAVDALVVEGGSGLHVYTLKSADHTYRILIEEMNEGALILARDSTILYSNIYFANLMGLPLEDLIGKSFLDFISKKDVGEVEKLFGEANIEIGKLEATLQGVNRKQIPVSIALKMFKEEDMPVLNMTITDISEQRAAHRKIRKYQKDLERKIEELKTSNNELEQFAYVASHDLMEPLRMVTNFTQLLLKHLDAKDEDSLEFQEFILSGISRMEIMIKDLLQYSRVGRKDIRFELVDMNEIMDTVKDNLFDIIKETRADIHYGNLPTIRAVRGLMTQVLQNLVGNAIKFRRKDVAPEIKITAERADDMWELCVKDNGIGIDEKYAERIFVIFQRLHTTDKYPGSGIGLAISKKIIDFHGGKIWLEPVFEEGCTFHFTLPADGPDRARNN